MSLDDSIFVARKEFISRDVGGELVVVPINEAVAELASVFVLSDVAKEIWNCLQEASCPSQIVTKLERLYDASTEQIQTDVESFLKDAMQAGLIECLDDVYEEDL
ncbi:MAG: PqqD family protein [Myxococcales bacterium]|nr:MAG: PqqD family protein [Myxococcales bacterium]